MSRLAAAWNRFWFRPVAPHLYAALRILWGLLALMNLFGVADLQAYWYLDGLVAPAPTLTQSIALRFGPDTAVAPWIIGGSALVYVLMILGLGSSFTVALAFVALFVEKEWNQLPLSSAFQVHFVLMFCLALADTGEVWSLDAWLRRRRGNSITRTTRIWPLRLFRAQVALIYFMTGFWKFQDVHWRDGSALHYVMSNFDFRRFPVPPPAWADGPLTFLTYLTLIWELAFPFLLLNRVTRFLALGLGVALHFGMWTLLEIGPFSFVMIGSYLAFVDPDWFAATATRLQERWAQRRRATSARP
jgi:hypothetical protein